MAGMPATGLSTSVVAMEEMTLGHLMIIFRGRQVLVLREISDRGEGRGYGEGGRRKKWADKCFSS